jgi:hypothetical protein
MTKPKKGISERAIEFLEDNGYLSSVRAQMKAEVIKALVELEEAGEIPPSLRINRYTPPDDLNKEAIAYVLEFLNHHKLTNSAICLVNEVNLVAKGQETPQIEKKENEGEFSLLAQKIDGGADDTSK